MFIHLQVYFQCVLKLKTHHVVNSWGKIGKLEARATWMSMVYSERKLSAVPVSLFAGKRPWPNCVRAQGRHRVPASDTPDCAPQVFPSWGDRRGSQQAHQGNTGTTFLPTHLTNWSVNTTHLHPITCSVVPSQSCLMQMDWDFVVHIYLQCARVVSHKTKLKKIGLVSS